MHHLSLATWIIHSTTLFEWMVVIELSWRYAYSLNSQKLLRLTYPMLLAFVSALSACCWHIFYNRFDLEWFVLVQSLTTLFSNFVFFIVLIT
uniref:Uncharacterized protein n=1 Tax=Gronococcus sybilensis TaxID=3028029 RepID=A0A9Y1I2J4_9RHOD|nr:hypothetical protein GRSY_102 [Gronococcus sybilensis]